MTWDGFGSNSQGNVDLMVNVSAFLPKVTDTLLTSGQSVDGGGLRGGRGGERMHTQGNSHHLRTINHRGRAVLFLFSITRLSLRVIQGF